MSQSKLLILIQGGDPVSQLRAARDLALRAGMSVSQKNNSRLIGMRQSLRKPERAASAQLFQIPRRALETSDLRGRRERKAGVLSSPRVTEYSLHGLRSVFVPRGTKRDCGAGCENQTDEIILRQG
jgi:hypothetical protein